MAELINRQDAINVVAKSYRYESDRMTALQGVPVINSEGIRLTDEEIDCFNAYIEDAKIDIAFGNTDWRNIYYKIVGNKVSDYAREKMQKYAECN